MSRLLTVREAAEYLGLSPRTISTYTYLGKIESQAKSPGGNNLYNEEYLASLKDQRNPPRPPFKVFYSRSSNGNDVLLNTQESLLKEEYGKPDLIIKDKASGLNENRPGLRKLLKLSHQDKITDVYITSRDRLTRFGYSYLETLLSYNDVKLHVLDQDNGTMTRQSPEDELLQDFMSLIASFSGKFYRMRGHAQQRALLQKAGAEIDRREEENENAKAL